jgi:hypothetical protein
MRKTLAFLFLLALCCLTGRGVIVYAQEEDAPAYDETIPEEGEDDDYDSEDGSFSESDINRFIPDKYTMGDQTITISLGMAFPAVFAHDGKPITHNITPPIGINLSLAYTYFLGPNLFIGGEIGFLTLFTLSKNALFFIPFGIRGGWQFTLGRFEFPLFATIGVVPQRYLDFGYFGMYLKGTTQAYFRYNPNWSFGLSADWGWYPQWPLKDGKRAPEYDIDAHIIGVTLSARYHF